jgi:hypothetical protein
MAPGSPLVVELETATRRLPSADEATAYQYSLLGTSFESQFKPAFEDVKMERSDPPETATSF